MAIDAQPAGTTQPDPGLCTSRGGGVTHHEAKQHFSLDIVYYRGGYARNKRPVTFYSLRSLKAPTSPAVGQLHQISALHKSSLKRPRSNTVFFFLFLL